MSTCTIDLNAGSGGKPAELCGKPAAFTARAMICTACRTVDPAGCPGHPVCAVHGDELGASAGTATLARLTLTPRCRGLDWSSMDGIDFSPLIWAAVILIIVALGVGIGIGLLIG